MVNEFKVSYKVKWSENGEPREGSLNIIEPNSKKAIEMVEKIIRRNVFENYPQIIEISAKKINPQGTILPRAGGSGGGKE